MLATGLDVLPGIRGQLFNLGEILFPAIAVARTPSRLVHRDTNTGFSLIHYEMEGRKPTTGRILFVPHIVNRPYLLDLNDDVSVVRRFFDSGFDVYSIDWGYPMAEQESVSLLDYTRYVGRSLEIISGQEKTSILGYCTGGIITLIYASLHPDNVKNIILLATPVDFSRRYDPRIFWVNSIDPHMVTLLTGNVPGELFNSFGYYLLAWYLPLFSTSREFVDEFLTWESWRDGLRKFRWQMDAPPVPAKAYREFIEGCYQKNLLIKNKLELNGSRVDLTNIACPLLNILARYDHLVPAESATAIKRVYAGKDYSEIIFRSSHIGLSVSIKAHKELWSKVCDWLKARS